MINPSMSSGFIPFAVAPNLLDLSSMETGDRIAENLKRLIDADARSARAISLEAGLGPSGVRDILVRKTRNPTYHSLLMIAAVLGVDVVELTDGARAASSIAIAGKVGAGAKVPLFDAYEKGDGPQVECPPGLGPHGVVAVEVEGDSMEPVYSAGDLLFYTRNGHVGVPTEALGRRCVCEDADGHAWVKQVKAGRDPGTFDLHSINPGVDPMWGVALKWAAPVRLHWPAELAVRLG